MSANLAILTIGVVPVNEALPYLTENIREDQITHISLLGKMTREEVIEDYAAEPGEEMIVTLLNDNERAYVSKAKVERDLQAVIEVLDQQHYDVILFMSTAPITGLIARNAILLEPLRIIPPLVASIVDGHHVGVLVPLKELIPKPPPQFALADPMQHTDAQLVDAGRELIEKGADVLMLDCLGYSQKHRDLLQKVLDVPVLLSNILVARLAAELLV
ncbi:AroM family protein [Trabulsiella odontotermitis]|uniref:AroM family protein n=1 Tax=Trabulsiella odontotermitis TaxID=379893 RepID=UPI00067646F3|nr:AroM family protein [Trabulsiella odontotermitis]KNC92165.1 AroM protein [Trabulsiella odontotermitis]